MNILLWCVPVTVAFGQVLLIHLLAKTQRGALRALVLTGKLLLWVVLFVAFAKQGVRAILIAGAISIGMYHLVAIGWAVRLRKEG